MADDFNLDGDGLEPEASLDDFFQPSTEPIRGGGSRSDDAHLPVSKSQPMPPAGDDEPPPLGDDALGDVPAKPAGEGIGAKIKGLFSNKIVLAALGAVVLLGGGATAYLIFSGGKKSSEPVAAASETRKSRRDKDATEAASPAEAAGEAAEKPAAQPEPSPGKPKTPTKGKGAEAAPAEAPAKPAKTPAGEKAAKTDKTAKADIPAPETKTKLAPAKPESKKKPVPETEVSVPAPEAKTPAAKKTTSAKPEPAKPEVAKAPTEKTAAKPAAEKTATPALPAQPKAPAETKKVAKANLPPPSPKASVSGPCGCYTVQVGAYALKESQAEPLAKVTKLGLDYHFYPVSQSVGLYDVAVGKGLDKAAAEALADQLEAMNFAPRLESDGSGYKVIAYSYGNRAHAYNAKATIEKARLGTVVVSYAKKTMTLQQLRVGEFASRAAAQETVNRLHNAGFRPLIVHEL